MTDWAPLNKDKLTVDLDIFDRRIEQIITMLNWKLALEIQSSESEETSETPNKEISDQVESLKKLQKLTHEFVESLRNASADQNVTSKETFRIKFNEAVDELLKLDGFKKDRDLNPMTGSTALWSKLNQTFASDIAKHKKGVTLESSLAGHLFDGLSWGTSWSTDPDAPMKQFWMRMSVEIARAATNSKDKTVDLYVLEQVVKESAFFTDEWPRIKESIAKGELKALYLYKYELAENKRDRDIFIMDSLPDAATLQENFNKSYIFIKKSKTEGTLYYAENGSVTQLKMSEDNIQDKARIAKYLEVIHAEPSSTEPLDKDSNAARNLRYMISRNPDHKMWHTLKTGNPIEIKTQAQLEREIETQTAEYKKYQQLWQNLQSAKGKARQWAESVVHLNRTGKLEAEYGKIKDKARAIRENKVTSHPLDDAKSDLEAKQEADQTNKFRRR